MGGCRLFHGREGLRAVRIGAGSADRSALRGAAVGEAARGALDNGALLRIVGRLPAGDFLQRAAAADAQLSRNIETAQVDTGG